MSQIPMRTSIPEGSVQLEMSPSQQEAYRNIILGKCEVKGDIYTSQQSALTGGCRVFQKLLCEATKDMSGRLGIPVDMVNDIVQNVTDVSALEDCFSKLDRTALFGAGFNPDGLGLDGADLLTILFYNSRPKMKLRDDLKQFVLKWLEPAIREMGSYLRAKGAGPAFDSNAEVEGWADGLQADRELAAIQRVFPSNNYYQEQLHSYADAKELVTCYTKPQKMTDGSKRWRCDLTSSTQRGQNYKVRGYSKTSDGCKEDAAQKMWLQLTRLS
ncbi:hypothetical protein TWF281_002434 [Arthrobotrys megalospora]